MDFTCPPAPPVATDDLVVVVWKSAFALGVYDKGALARNVDQDACWPVALGGNPVGDKVRRGDERTPEGEYRVTHKNPKSQFHLSLGLDYPQTKHADAGLAAGIIDQATRDRVATAHAARGMPVRTTELGGDIYIHGGGTFSPSWTDGCVALDNEAMDWLFATARAGTRVVILP